MDPQIKSILTSVLLAVATAGTTWGVSKGLVPAADQNVIANDLVTLAFGVVTGLVGWWKARQVSPTAMIQAVNAADNGVKVVAQEANAQAVNSPLKEAGK